MNVIETQDLRKNYGKRRRQIKAVDGISFQVEKGQIFGFLGPNGSGKTTTIGMLLGIINPTSGVVRLLGKDGEAGLHAARQKVGATLETPNFYPHMSGRDNLRVVATVKGLGTKEIDEVLDTVGLIERQKDRFETYSLGMKQRLALAATLLGKPELLILDEPANGLDPEGNREIRDILTEFASRGGTVFVSSHVLAEVERTCTHVAIVKKGRIIAQSSVRDITTSGAQAILRAQDMTQLVIAAREYGNARLEGENVIVDLPGANLSDLNRFLANKGIYVSHLAQHSRPLEDVFLDLTSEGEA